MTNDELMQLTGKLKELLRPINVKATNVDKSDLLALIAKVESLAADAERYQWLREPKGLDVLAVHDPRGFRCFSHGLDEVVDAAMAKEKA